MGSGTGSINAESIQKKAEQYLNTQKMRKKIWKKTDDYMIGGIPVATEGIGQQQPAYKAGDNYIKVFRRVVNDAARVGLLGDAGVDTLSTALSVDPVERVRHRYFVHVLLFERGLHRDSLMPTVYDGVDNIVKLLNDGYVAKKSVYGYWHGTPIWSKSIRDGAHFIEDSKSKFMTKYPEYNVRKIETHYYEDY